MCSELLNILEKGSGNLFHDLIGVFKRYPDAEFIDILEKIPDEKQTRRLWFLYEFILQKTLLIPDVSKGDYVEALDSEAFYTSSRPVKLERYRILNNLLGDSDFCPVVRKTEKTMKKMPGDITFSGTYEDEVEASFKLEGETPDKDTKDYFAELLRSAGKTDHCTKTGLVEIQNRIVEPELRNNGYRTKQVYLGKMITPRKIEVHNICPKPDDIEYLMSGLIRAHNIMKEGSVSPLIHTAVIAFGFVLIHPFEDGNGRIHRFLMHSILSLRKAIPENSILPLSSVILENYDGYMNVFSRYAAEVMKNTEYKIDEKGVLTVLNDTADIFRFPDMTEFVEYFVSVVDKTVKLHKPIKDGDNR